MESQENRSYMHQFSSFVVVTCCLRAQYDIKIVCVIFVLGSV